LERNLMANRLIALSMTVFLLSSVLAAPASAQAAEDPKQPSVDNPHMHFWGTDDLSTCWTHFDGNGTEGSSADGFGESTVTNGKHEVDFTCRIQENFKHNLYLDSNGTMFLEFTVDVYAPGECSQSTPCEELNVTLLKGNQEIAKEQFNGVDSGDPDTRTWQIPVDSNTTRWNKSVEEPAINFRWVGNADSGPQCIIFLCDSYFKFYYSNNEDGEPSEMNFPVINMTDAVEPDGEGDGDGDGGSLPGGLPGFGLMAGLGALAIAAVAANQRTEQE
jgi:hypothetical protein